MSAFSDYINSLLPIAYFRLGDAIDSSVAVDETGDHNGTYVNGPTLERTSLVENHIDYAVKFDGIDQYVTVPTIIASNDLSFIAFAKADDNTAGAVVTLNNSGHGALIQVNSGDVADAVRFYANGSTTSADFTISNIDVQSINMYVLVLSNNGLTLTGYINGVLVGTDTVSGPEDIQDSFINVIATSRSLTTNVLNGKVDEVSIFDYALSLSEIEEAYRLSGNAVNDIIMANNPYGYWKFDETSGDALDSSGNARTLIDAGALTYAQEFQIAARKCLQFDGGNMYSASAGGMNYANYSYCFFYRLEQGAGGHFLMWKGGSGTTYDWGVYSGGVTNNPSLAIYHYQASGGVVATAISPNEYQQRHRWHHVAVTYDGTTLRIYFNGILGNSLTLNPLRDSGNTLRLAMWGTSSTGGALQSITDAAIFPGVLSQTDILKIVDGSTLFTFNKDVHADYLFGLTPINYWTFNKTLVDEMGDQNGTHGADGVLTLESRLIIGDESASLWFNESTVGSTAVEVGTVGQFLKAQSFTVVATIEPYRDAAVVQRQLFGCFSGGKGMYVGLNNIHHLVFRMTNTDTTNDLYVITDAAIESGSVHSVAFLYDGSGLSSGITIYANGIVLPHTATYNTLTADPVYVGNTYIGAAEFGITGANKLHALVSHIAIFDSIISEVEVTNLYDTAIGGAPTLPPEVVVIFNKLVSLFSPNTYEQIVISNAIIESAIMITKAASFVINKLFGKVTDLLNANQSSVSMLSQATKNSTLITPKSANFNVHFLSGKATDIIVANNFIFGYLVSVNIVTAYFSTYAATFSNLSKINTSAENITAKNNTVSVISTQNKSINEITVNSFSAAIVASITSVTAPFIGLSFSLTQKTLFNINSTPILGKNVSALMLSSINKATITTITYPVTFTKKALQQLTSDLITALDFTTRASGQREVIEINCFINKNNSTIQFINRVKVENMYVSKAFTPNLNITSVFANDNAIMTTVEINTEL